MKAQSQTAETLDVSVIIVSFNTRDLLRECLTTLQREAAGLACQTIVIDNASRDGSADMVRAEFPTVQLIASPTNLGFAAANNLGFAEARGRYVVLLNSDAFLRPDALRQAVALMDAHPKAGLAGGRLVGRDDSWQPSARMFPSVVNEFLSLSGLSVKFPQSRFFGRVDRTWADQNAAAEVDWVPGAFAILRRAVLTEVGPFDADFFLYYEEVDLCRRIKAAGYEVWYWPEIVVVHLGGESSKTLAHLTLSNSGAQLTLWRLRSEFLYYRKHHGVFSAWLAKAVETGWHKLRCLKTVALRQEATRQTYSQQIIKLAAQAWRETQGGLVSPPRPW